MIQSIFNTGKALEFRAGVQSITVGISRMADGSLSVSLGEPFCAEITTRSCNGRKQYQVLAPQSTKIEKAPS